MTSLKSLAFVHIALGSLTVAVTIFLVSADRLETVSYRAFTAGFHAMGDFCTVARYY